MKKKFTLHLDALIVIIVLFISSVGLALFLQRQVTELTKENQQLQWKGVADELNLSSQKNYIMKLEKQLEDK